VISNLQAATILICRATGPISSIYKSNWAGPGRGCAGWPLSREVMLCVHGFLDKGNSALGMYLPLPVLLGRGLSRRQPKLRILALFNFNGFRHSAKRYEWTPTNLPGPPRFPSSTGHRGYPWGTPNSTRLANLEGSPALDLYRSYSGKRASSRCEFGGNHGIHGT
jgi:hypothetical protein